MTGNYDDIINMERPVSKRHSPMPAENRAAQFSPFAALTGYDDCINETNRVTDKRIEPDDGLKAELDMKLSEIAASIHDTPSVSVTYFVPDETKDGGKYFTITKKLIKIDSLSRQLVFKDKTSVYIDDIIELSRQDE